MKSAVVIALIVVAAAANAAPPIQPPQGSMPRTVLIFADVTSSLTMKQSERVGDLTAQVLASLAPGTGFAVYAIQADAEAPAFCEGEMPVPRNSRERQEAAFGRMKLQSDVKSRLADLYCSINWNDPGTQEQCRERRITPNPQEDLRSCVLRSVKHAAKAIENAEAARGGPVEVVYISDMIEECRETPLGQAVRLTRTAIQKQIEAAAKLSFSSDLRRSRVTVVLPRVLNDGAGGRSDHPVFDQVEGFWKVVFTRAKADMTQWYFNTALPPRMQRAAQ